MNSLSFTTDLRADVYREIAGYLGAPLDHDDVAALRRTRSFGPLANLADDPRVAADIARALHAALAPPSDAEAEALLNRSFGLLFLGIGAEGGAPPFESAYRATGRLFQEPAAEMTELLSARGLMPQLGFVEAPDHIAIELSLLEQLMRLEATIVGAGERLAIEAMRARLLSWVPSFAAACAANDPSAFYGALAAVLVTLLAADDETGPS